MIVLHKTIEMHSKNQLIKTTDNIVKKPWRVATISIPSRCDECDKEYHAWPTKQINHMIRSTTGNGWQ